MTLELTHVQAEALIPELSQIVRNDHYPLSPRIVALKEILGQLRPEPEREPLPPRKVYVPPSIATAAGETPGDFALTDINSLDAETRCLVLVGKFLQKWAWMEGALHTAMQIALGLDTFQTAIVTSNTQLRRKINILGTLISGAPFEREKIDRFKKTLNDIDQAAGNRNMMAHDAFAPSSDGRAVSFSVTKARGGPLLFPETLWDVSRFEKEYAAIERLQAGVEEIIEAIKQKDVIDRMRETARVHPAALYYFTGFVQGTPRALLDSLSSDTGTAAPKTDD
jgi:hypothetical protein